METDDYKNWKTQFKEGFHVFYSLVILVLDLIEPFSIILTM